MGYIPSTENSFLQDWPQFSNWPQGQSPLLQKKMPWRKDRDVLQAICFFMVSPRQGPVPSHFLGCFPFAQVTKGLVPPRFLLDFAKLLLRAKPGLFTESHTPPSQGCSLYANSFSGLSARKDWSHQKFITPPGSFPVLNTSGHPSLQGHLGKVGPQPGSGPKSCHPPATGREGLSVTPQSCGLPCSNEMKSLKWF